MEKIEVSMKKITFLKFLLVPALFFVIACEVIGTPAPTPDTLGTVVAETLTSMPVIPTQVESTPVPGTITPIPAFSSLAPEAVGTQYVYTQAQNVNLRVNPGRLFKVSRVLPQGTRLQLLGFAPGRQWLNVVNDEGVIGWIDADFTGGFDGQLPPVVDPKDVQVVTGTVLDVNGDPIGGIGFAVVQGSQREEASTDGTGTFYAFLPTKFSGTWNVIFVSVVCTSNTMDLNCNCLGDVCGKPDPEMVSITLPISAPLSFVWK
jgi:SH3-like domain-containing protein